MQPFGPDGKRHTRSRGDVATDFSACADREYCTCSGCNLQEGLMAQILHAFDASRPDADTGTAIAQIDVLGPDAEHRAGGRGPWQPCPCRDSIAKQVRRCQEVHSGTSDEAGNKGICRRLVELGRRADLHDPPLVHHCDPVAHGHRLNLIVGNVNRRRAELSLHFENLTPHRTFIRTMA